MIDLKKKMTMTEIDEAEKEIHATRKRALDAFKAGTMKSHEVNIVRRSCDTMLTELARRKKAAK